MDKRSVCELTNPVGTGGVFAVLWVVYVKGGGGLGQGLEVWGGVMSV